MSNYLKLVIITLSLFLMSCSTSKIYSEKGFSWERPSKVCGESFCVLIKTENLKSEIHVTENKDLSSSTDYSVQAFCLYEKRKSYRALHLGYQYRANKKISLESMRNYWEFSTKQLKENCRLHIQVTTKDKKEEFQYPVNSKI